MIRHSPIRLHRTLPFTLVVFLLGIAATAVAQFETRATHMVQGEALSAAIGDFNGDGIPDLAVPGQSLSVFLGKGDGTFQSPINYPGTFYYIATADFNNDGILDLVVTLADSSVSVFLGNGDGTFQSPKTSYTTATVGAIAVGDFNGDHKTDIAVVDHPYVSVLLGNGDGTFQSPINNDSFVDPLSLTVGDFNNDHILDVAVAGSFGATSSIGVLLGNGNGTLQSALTYTLPYVPSTVAAADFNGDGNLDVVVGDYLNEGVTVLLGNGNGTFGPEQTYLGGGGLVFVGDFNLDGKLDIVAGPSEPGVSEFLGNGDGTFQAANVYLSDYGYPAAWGDLNGDKMPDLALLGNPSGVTTMLNTGVANFSPSSPLTFPTQLVGTTSSQVIATLTNDGAFPLAISSVSSSGGAFSVRSTCRGSVAPGGSCSVTATFAPRAKGAASGIVTLHDSASSKPQVIELAGTGTVVKLSPPKLTFAAQKSGTTSPAQHVQLTNAGSAPLDFTSAIYIGGPDERDFFESNNCPKSLAAGTSCFVSVVFAPRERGVLTASVVISSNGGGSPQNVPLSGTGD